MELNIALYGIITRCSYYNTYTQDKMGNTCMRKKYQIPKPITSIDINRTTYLSDRNQSNKIASSRLDEVCGQTVSYIYRTDSPKQQLVGVNDTSTNLTLEGVHQRHIVQSRNIPSPIYQSKKRIRNSDLTPIKISQATKVRAQDLWMSGEAISRKQINTPVPINSDGSLKKHHSSYENYDDYLRSSQNISPHNVIYQNSLEIHEPPRSSFQNY